jgi:hypothetical protein
MIERETESEKDNQRDKAKSVAREEELMQLLQFKDKQIHSLQRYLFL